MLRAFNCQLPTANCQKGFTLLGLLFLIAGMGVAMAAVGTLWHTAAQREKEKELLFAGDEYRRAITSFWQASPKGQERLPKSVAELLADPRFLHTVRHLRRPYRDPMTGSAEWGLVKGPDGGIAGVYSLSDGKPFKEANFPPPYGEFKGLPNYRAWIFMFSAAAQPPAPAAGKDAAPPPPATPNSNENKTGSPAQNDDPSSGMDWAKKLGACQDARMRGYLSCQAVLEQSGKDAWLACVNPVSEQFNSCVAQR